jgi:thiol-disulfide isomerase/thioredoxin
MWRALLGAGWALLLLVALTDASAGIPEPYAAIVVEPSIEGRRHHFDLNPALERARAENKRLYVYLGARDCPYCRKYEAFLNANAAELVPHFIAERYLVVDLRSALSVRSDMLFIKAGESSRVYVDFQTSIGDERTRQVVYPSVWLLDANLKPLMQMPAGTGTFETVEEQLEILRLVQ